MMYEISKEAFKQRLENKLNFVFVNIGKDTIDGLEGNVHMAYSNQFVSQFTGKYSNKNQNIILFSLNKEEENLKNAASELAHNGYKFIYYYYGQPHDVILDKGLN